VRTQAELEAAYEVRNGVIVTPCAYKGEPLWVPFYWEAAMEGMADEVRGDPSIFHVCAGDRWVWRELRESTQRLLLSQSGDHIHGEEERET